tara:strand:- start:493 stop:993 length:501 start_codon:yes stop_codon:yes gene_type:complete
MTKLELDKVYSFKVDELFHPNCLKSVVTSMTNKIRKDGRTSSPIMTSFVSEKWFPSLTYVDQKFIDFIGDFGQYKYNIEKKMYTLYGTKFCPSYMVGKGRVIDPVESRRICEENKLIYLICNALFFPHVYITFKDGIQLHDDYKSCCIGHSNKQSQKLFGINVPSK